MLKAELSAQGIVPRSVPQSLQPQSWQGLQSQADQKRHAQLPRIPPPNDVLAPSGARGLVEKPAPLSQQFKCHRTRCTKCGWCQAWHNSASPMCTFLSIDEKRRLALHASAQALEQEKLKNERLQNQLESLKSARITEQFTYGYGRGNNFF